MSARGVKEIKVLTPRVKNPILGHIRRGKGDGENLHYSEEWKIWRSRNLFNGFLRFEFIPVDMKNNILEWPICTFTMKGIQLRRKTYLSFHWIRGIPTSFRGSPFVLFASIMLKWLFFSNKQYRPHHQSEELLLDWEMWEYGGGESLLVDSPLFSSFLLRCCGWMERAIWKKTTKIFFSQQNILDCYGRSF